MHMVNYKDNFENLSPFGQYTLKITFLIFTKQLFQSEVVLTILTKLLWPYLPKSSSSNVIRININMCELVFYYILT